MTFTLEDRELILNQYLAWVDKVSDELEDKTHFHPEEIVHKVLELVENKIIMDDKLKERASWRDSVEESEAINGERGHFWQGLNFRELFNGFIEVE